MPSPRRCHLASAASESYGGHVEHEREWPLDVAVGELRADVRHLGTGVMELRQDVRRLDARLFQLLLAQIATLGAALAAVIAAVAH